MTRRRSQQGDYRRWPPLIHPNTGALDGQNRVLACIVIWTYCCLQAAGFAATLARCSFWNPCPRNYAIQQCGAPAEGLDAIICKSIPSSRTADTVWYGVSVPLRGITITLTAKKEEQDRDLSHVDVPLFPASLSAAKGSSRDLRQVSKCDIR